MTRLSTTHAYLTLHFCVLLWGFTAILGKLISLDALTLVWWRLLLACGGLYLLGRGLPALKRIPRERLWVMVGAGLLITAHWLTFYLTVKIASASVAVLCMTLAPVATALIGPKLLGKAFRARDLVLASLVLPGMLLAFGGAGAEQLPGILIGLVSALLVALFSIVNKGLVAETDAVTLSFVELATGLLALSLLLPFFGFEGFWPSEADWPWLILFAFGCTVLPFVLSQLALRQLTPFATQFAVNLEPVYGIVLAAWMLGEAKLLGPAFYAGAVLVLLAVLAQPALEWWKRRAAAAAMG
jgi:drug/metabolite transporter (DMT)-like permease